MLFPRALLRPTTLALLLAVLWAVLHPAIINAAQSSTHRVLVCTPNGMEWVESEYASIETLLGLQERAAPHSSSSEAALTWMAPCPFSHAGQVLPLHDGLTRLPDPLLKAYWIHPPPAAYTSPLAVSAEYRLAPPSRAPPALPTLNGAV